MTNADRPSKPLSTADFYLGLTVAAALLLAVFWFRRYLPSTAMMLAPPIVVGSFTGRAHSARRWILLFFRFGSAARFAPQRRPSISATWCSDFGRIRRPLPLFDRVDRFPAKRQPKKRRRIRSASVGATSGH